MENQQVRKPIRSFVRRQGRKTISQQLSFTQYWPTYGIDYQPSPIDFTQAFGREAPLIVEVGFGMGDSLWQMAKASPELNFLGIEVHEPGVGHLISMLVKEEITNVRVMCHDAVEIFKHAIAPATVSRLQIYFPDPWPKKRHHKRRLIQPSFLDLCVPLLQAQGIIHCATDWENYAEQMLEVLSAREDLKNVAGVNQYSERPAYRPQTKFETRGQRLGHGIWDLLFQV